MLFIVVRFSHETLASWHCSLHNPLFHKDHSALLSTHPQTGLQIEMFLTYVILMIFFLWFK